LTSAHSDDASAAHVAAIFGFARQSSPAHCDRSESFAAHDGDKTLSYFSRHAHNFPSPGVTSAQCDFRSDAHAATSGASPRMSLAEDAIRRVMSAAHASSVTFPAAWFRLRHSNTAPDALRVVPYKNSSSVS
jgi:hypothetical protein